jgi:hypothetical protein
VARLGDRLRLASHRQQLFLVVRAGRAKLRVQQKAAAVALLDQAAQVGRAVRGIQLLGVVLAAAVVVIMAQ